MKQYDLPDDLIKYITMFLLYYSMQNKTRLCPKNIRVNNAFFQHQEIHY
jgi:hypothetical protein